MNEKRWWQIHGNVRSVNNAPKNHAVHKPWHHLRRHLLRPPPSRLRSMMCNRPIHDNIERTKDNPYLHFCSIVSRERNRQRDGATNRVRTVSLGACLCRYSNHFVIASCVRSLSCLTERLFMYIGIGCDIVS